MPNELGIPHPYNASCCLTCQCGGALGKGRSVWTRRSSIITPGYARARQISGTCYSDASSVLRIGRVLTELAIFSCLQAETFSCQGEPEHSPLAGTTVYLCCGRVCQQQQTNLRVAETASANRAVVERRTKGTPRWNPYRRSLEPSRQLVYLLYDVVTFESTIETESSEPRLFRKFRHTGTVPRLCGREPGASAGRKRRLGGKLVVRCSIYRDNAGMVGIDVRWMAILAGHSVNQFVDVRFSLRRTRVPRARSTTTMYAIL